MRMFFTSLLFDLILATHQTELENFYKIIRLLLREVAVTITSFCKQMS